MFAQILGETTCGIDGVQILVEVDVSNGLPSFDLVGLPAMAVREPLRGRARRCSRGCKSRRACHSRHRTP